jgi:starch synthase
MRNGMAKDFSWKKPAAEYAALYEEVARRRS